MVAREIPILLLLWALILAVGAMKAARGSWGAVVGACRRRLPPCCQPPAVNPASQEAQQCRCHIAASSQLGGLGEGWLAEID